MHFFLIFLAKMSGWNCHAGLGKPSPEKKFILGLGPKRGRGSLTKSLKDFWDEIGQPAFSIKGDSKLA